MSKSKITNFLIRLIILLILPQISQSATLVTPPLSKHFKRIKVENLAEHMSKTALISTQKLIVKNQCTQDNITGYQKSNNLIVTVACYPQESYKGYNRYIEYPLTILIQEGVVREINLTKYGFMYEDGQILYITDMDKNNMPELWLSGSLCEGDGLDENEYEFYCTGGVTVEITSDSVELWKNRKGWKSPWKYSVYNIEHEGKLP